jgi:hypothetical protein
MNLRLSLIAAAAALTGCAPAATSPMDGGGDMTVAVTYTHDAQPIFMAKCSPCHAGQTLGMHNIATTYSDALIDVTSVDAQGCWGGMDPATGDLTMPKKVGECALISINNGWMPYGAACSNSTPLDPAACLSADQKAVITAWVAAGMPQ